MATSNLPHVNPYGDRELEAGARAQAPDASPVQRAEHRESLLTRLIENQTAKVPSNVFLFAALCAMGLSFASEIRNRPRLSRLAGMWVDPLLTMGLYNKIVKTFGGR